ncbi:site-specific integrase [Alteromonas sp. a30]|uniref:site-specific integrase n=1 Tax=Alteromonas sp. a30 TaxID=2730917 RepID=UPI0022818961|nr:site-specific integrase [Alteromonas sp. a30]MCY7297070.1 site-specific integrase [Alteromonas sp. a30]
MAKREKITNTSVKALIPEDWRLNDTEIPGFHALISKAGKVSYYLYYRVNGKQANYKIGVHGQITPAQARDIAKVKAGEVANGIDVHKEMKRSRRETKEGKSAILEIFLNEKYLPWLMTRNARTAEKTVKVIKKGFSSFLKRPLSEITAFDIEKWRNEKRKIGMKPATVNSYVNPLKGAMSRAVEWGIIKEHDLNKVKSLKVDNAVVRFLSENEECSIRKALRERDSRIKAERDSGNQFREARNYSLLPDLKKRQFVDHLEPLVLLAMNTGMRRGELLSLEWFNVDLTNRVITIKGEKAKSGKTRHIPLNGEAHTSLSSWREINPQSTYVFEGEQGKPITDIKKAWNNLLEAANINNFRFHDLRHHFASKLVMAGVDLNTVRELLGHGNLEMTLRYAHLAPEHKAAAVNLIG